MAYPPLPDWVNTVQETAKYLSMVSIVTVIMPIATFVTFPSKRQYPARLPIHMCIATLGLCMSVLLGIYHPVSFCAYQAIGIQFFGLAAVLWWLVISFNFYQVAVKDRVEPMLERYFVAVGWGIPLIIAVVAKLTDQLDTSPSFASWECWMSDIHGWAQWALFYGEMAAACLLGLLLWPQIAMRIYRTHIKPSIDATSVAANYLRHIIFIVFYFMVFAFLFTYRVTYVVGSPGYTLSLLHTICVSGTGLYCFIVFGLSLQNLRLWKQLFCCQSTSDATASQPLLHPRGPGYGGGSTGTPFSGGYGYTYPSQALAIPESPGPADDDLYDVDVNGDSPQPTHNFVYSHS